MIIQKSLAISRRTTKVLLYSPSNGGSKRWDQVDVVETHETGDPIPTPTPPQAGFRLRFYMHVESVVKIYCAILTYCTITHTRLLETPETHTGLDLMDRHLDFVQVENDAFESVVQTQ